MFGRNRREAKEAKEKLERIEKILQADCITCVWCSDKDDLLSSVMLSNDPSESFKIYCADPEIETDPDFNVKCPYARKNECSGYFNLADAPEEIKKIVNNYQKNQLTDKLAKKLTDLLGKPSQVIEGPTTYKFGKKPKN